MGVLTMGQPLTWAEIQPNRTRYLERCIQGLIYHYQQVADNQAESGWLGEEIEYCLAPVNNNQSLYQIDTLTQGLNASHLVDPGTLWNPEYSVLMIEGVSKQPYHGLREVICHLESNLQLRRRHLACRFPGRVPTLAFPPYLGHPDIPVDLSQNIVSQSEQVEDAVIHPHPRFAALTANIRERRQRRVHIPISIYQDYQTQEPNRLLDCMAYGMGSCCLQVTYQAKHLTEARQMFDAMMVLSPLMLSISAASPIYQGRLLDTDTRWSVISSSVDDRTTTETDRHGTTSRYSTSRLYLGKGANEFHDVPIEYERSMYQRLLSETDMDTEIAAHLAHLAARDPLIVYPEHLESEEVPTITTFQMLQSTVWQDVRLKIPRDANDSWKMEFRPMEIQLTDSDNTALLLFVTVYLRTVLAYQLDYRIPVSKLVANVTTSEIRDSCRQGKFYHNRRGRIELLSLNEIFMKPKVGIWWQMQRYVESLRLDSHTKFALLEYLSIVLSRIQGNRLTPAQQIRTWVHQNPLYHGNSVVGRDLLDQLVQRCHEIGLGENQTLV